MIRVDEYGPIVGRLAVAVGSVHARCCAAWTDQYEIVDVRTPRGVRRAMLFPKAILQAELAANAPLRERMAIKRERMRAEKQKR